MPSAAPMQIASSALTDVFSNWTFASPA